METAKSNIIRKRKHCAVPGCIKKGEHMFRFPKNPTVRAQWKDLCKIERAVSDHMMICERHFKEGDIQVMPSGRHRIKKTVLPALRLPKDDFQKKLGRRCIVLGCNKRGEEYGITFHRFPLNETRQTTWRHLCHLLTTQPTSADTRICSNHFNEEDFEYKDNCRKLKQTHGIVPSRNLREGSPGNDPQIFFENLNSSELYSADESESSEDCDLTPKDCKHTPITLFDKDPVAFSKLQNDTHGEMHDMPGQSPVEEVSGSFSQFTDKEIELVTSSAFDDLLDIIAKVSSSSETVSSTATARLVLGSPRYNTKQLLNSSIEGTLVSSDTSGKVILNHESLLSINDSETSASKYSDIENQIYKSTVLDLMKTDDSLCILTGIDFSLLNCLCLLVSKVWVSDTIEIPLRISIAMTLCKLRLNLSCKCLSLLLGIDHRRCAFYFASTINKLAIVLRYNVYWPTKEETLKNFPTCFGKFKGTRVVLDSIAVSVDSPDCLKCRNRLFARYENLVSVKFMIGVTPSGRISYVSKVYGGRASNKKIFEESDLIVKDMLEPFSDAVMIDEEFCIDRICTAKYIKIHRRPLVQEKYQVNRQHALCSAAAANSLMHVECVIQRMNCFKILQSKLSWATVPHIDDIIIVIAGLVNMGSPVL